MTDDELKYSRYISGFNADKQKYVNLKNQLTGTLIPALSSPSKDLENAIAGLGKGFSIDEVGVDESQISDDKKKIDAIISKINGTVIPEIDAKINSINGSIDYYSYLLRKEREAKK